MNTPLNIYVADFEKDIPKIDLSNGVQINNKNEIYKLDMFLNSKNQVSQGEIIYAKKGVIYPENQEGYNNFPVFFKVIQTSPIEINKWYITTTAVISGLKITYYDENDVIHELTISSELYSGYRILKSEAFTGKAKLILYEQNIIKYLVVHRDSSSGRLYFIMEDNPDYDDIFTYSWTMNFVKPSPAEESIETFECIGYTEYNVGVGEWRNKLHVKINDTSFEYDCYLYNHSSSCPSYKYPGPGVLLYPGSNMEEILIKIMFFEKYGDINYTPIPELGEESRYYVFEFNTDSKYPYIRDSDNKYITLKVIYSEPYGSGFAKRETEIVLRTYYGWHEPITIQPAYGINKILLTHNNDGTEYDIDENGFRSNPYVEIMQETNEKYKFIPKGVILDYISLIWKDEYNAPGTFKLVVVDTEENRELLKINRYLFIEKSDKVMIIEKLKFNANLKSDGYILEVSGRSLESILERRVAFPGIGLNTNVCKSDKGMIHGLYTLVHNYFIDPTKSAQQSSDGETYFYYPERKIPFMDDSFLDNEDGYYHYDEALKREFNNSINKTIVKDNLLKVIQEQCQASYLGFKIIPHKDSDSGEIKWRFILYTGDDKSYSRSDKTKPLMIFSPKLSNVNSVATTEDNTNYKNVVFCGTERDADTYIDLTTSVFEKSGIDLKMPKIITGLKEQVVNKITESPPCYTGVLYLALAAARTDKDYNPTVVNITGLNDVLNETFSIQPKDNSIYELPYISSNSLPYLNANAISEYAKYLIYGTNDYAYVYNKEIIIPAGIGQTENNDPYSFWLGFSNLPYRKDDDYHIIIDSTQSIDRCDGLHMELIYQAEQWNEGEKQLKIVIKNYMLGNGLWFFDQLYSFWKNREAPSDSGYNPSYLVIFTDNEGIDNRRLNISFRSGTDLSDQLVRRNEDLVGYVSFSGNINGVTKSSIEITRSDRNIKNKDTPIKSTNTSGYITKEQADNIFITYKKTYGDELAASSKVGVFRLSDINGTPEVDPDTGETMLVGGFKNSTAFGWLTTTILNQAIQDFNDSEWGNDGIIDGIIKNGEKYVVSLWFKTLDSYTSSSNMKRWLCQQYVSNTVETGLDRREVFVDEKKDDNDDWNASAISQWAANTKVIKTDNTEDEDSDEKINERLSESARKQSGEYRKSRELDADCETASIEYLGDGPNGYNLGDIIQIDDGRGNLEKKIISSVTIANDITDGFKIVPTFSEYTLIPKDYKQLDWIQVANMILPAVFNKTSNVSNTVNDNNISLSVSEGKEPKVYGGPFYNEAKPTEIISMYNEVAGIVTEIELSASYSLDPKNILTPNPRKKNFALISALGNYENGENNYHGLYIPMMLLATKRNNFTDFDLLYDNKVYPDTEVMYDRLIFRLGENCVLKDNKYYKNLGLGYKYSPNSAYNLTNFNNMFLSKNITFTDEPIDIHLNELVQDDIQINNSLHIATSNNRKYLIYSKSSINNDVISYRPQVDKFIMSNHSVDFSGAYLLEDDINFWSSNDSVISNFIAPGYFDNIGDDEFFLIRVSDIINDKENEFGNEENGTIANQYLLKNVTLTGYQNYGQLYYNYSEPHLIVVDEDAEDSTTLVNITNHDAKNPIGNRIILGGFAIAKTMYGKQYEDQIVNDVYFSKDDTIEDPRDQMNNPIFGFKNGPDAANPNVFCDEGYGDSNNGVRVFSLKIYEYKSSNRLCRYNNPDDVSGSFKSICYENRQNVYMDNSLFNGEYPDLSSKKLVHQYIPVEYVGGNQNEIVDDRERFGLYDTVEQTFVPVNWKWSNLFGNISINDQAVLIAYGGYTENI